MDCLRCLILSCWRKLLIIFAGEIHSKPASLLFPLSFNILYLKEIQLIYKRGKNNSVVLLLALGGSLGICN